MAMTNDNDDNNGGRQEIEETTRLLFEKIIFIVDSYLVGI